MKRGITLKKRFFINLVFFCVVLFVIRLYIDNNVIEISEHEVYFDNLPKEFANVRILHISDLHSKSFGRNNEQLCKKIRKIDPDYIMITGDMVNSNDTEFDAFLDFAKEIGNEYETYYIVGNHESSLKRNDYDRLISSVSNCGIKFLDNESITLTRADDTIRVYGMWYNYKFYAKEEFTLESMNKLVDNDGENFNILLAHNPKDFPVYGEWGADLVLSGHVHGGMVRLPYFGAVFAPDRTFFPKYSEGVYNLNDSQMVVNRGLGRGRTGFRLFNMPELGVVVLKSKQDL